MSTTLKHNDGLVHVETLENGKRKISVELLDDKLFMRKNTCETSYPVDLIEQILNIKGPAWLCDEIMRDEDPIIWYENYYFSVVTFTTLGFGDLQPQSNMPLVQICAMIEAVTGAFMMALFVLTFGRKMLR